MGINDNQTRIGATFSSCLRLWLLIFLVTFTWPLSGAVAKSGVVIKPDAMVEKTASAPAATALPEVVFIEGGIVGLPPLLTQARTSMETHALDPQRDGLAQMADILNGRGGIRAIHLFSHGAPGRLDLGALTLTSANVGDHAVDLARIGAALEKNADLLVYGCEVAKGDAGIMLVDELARMTGSNVAASTDPTGAAKLGGNWRLEAASGKIATNALELASFPGLLGADITFDFENDTSPVRDDNGETALATVTQTKSGETISVASTGGKFVVGEIYAILGQPYPGMASLVMAFDNLGAYQSTRVRISLPSGSTFNLSSFAVLDNYTLDHEPDPITIVSSSNAIYDVSAQLTIPADYGYAVINTASPGFPTAGFSNITYFDLYANGSNMQLALDNIALTNITAPDAAPTIANLNSDSVSYTEGASPVLLDSGGNATATEDVSWTGGKLLASFAANQDFVADLLGINNQGSAAGQIGLVNSYVTYGGTIIGTVGGGSGNLPLTVTFNSSATDAAVSALLQNLNFKTTDNSVPSTTSRTVRVTLSDSISNVSTNNDITVSVTAVNDSPTFSVGTGKVILATSPGEELGYAVAMQPDGKLLVAGNVSEVIDPANWIYSENNLLLARFNTDGSLDTSFGSSGFAKMNLWTSDTSYETGIAIAVLPDGKIVVGAGEPTTGNNQAKFGVARFNSDGTADTSFGTAGAASFTVGTENAASAHGMTMDARGNILLVGESQWRSGSVYQYTTVLRVKPDGTLDTTFGTSGIVTTNVGATTDYNYASGIALQPDGKIVVVGTQAGAYLLSVLRYNDNGSLDTSFGTSGTATFNVASSYDGGTAVAIQSDGKIIVGGNGYNGTNNDFMILRLTSTGALDTGFNTTGKVILDLGADDTVKDVVVQNDGKILVSGASGGQTAFVRLNSNGSLDTTFDGDGKLVVAGSETGEAAMLQGDGRIVAVGSHPDSTWVYYDLAVDRFNADGSPDSSFGAATNSLNGTPLYTQGDSPVVLDNDVAVFDAELSGASFSGATLTLFRSGGANTNDQFSASGTLAALTEGGNLTVGGTTIGTVTTNSGGTLLLTFGSNATETLINSAMRQIAYSNSIGSPSSLQINWIFSDGNTGSQGSGGALNVNGSITVTVISLNVSPTFVGATTTLTVNQNAGATDIKGLLHVSDTDASQTETWSQSVAPNHGGTLTFSGATASSGSSDITPGGTITYQPLNGYSGTETFTVQVSDGTASATRQITVTVVPVPTVTSVSVPSNGTYKVGDALNFTVSFDQIVTVTGTPSLSLVLNTGGTVQASYVSGSGTQNLVFRYTVASGNQDNDGITVGTLSLNSGTLKNSGGGDANLTLNSVGSTTAVLVDAVAPTVTSVSVPGNGTYATGQHLDFTLNFSENVTVNTTGGTPYIQVTLDTGGTVNAAYISGTGTSAILFRYTITSGNLDGNGIAVGAAISANGGTIKDAATNDATLTLNSVGSTTAVLVDAVPPTVTSVTVPANATYTAGQQLDFTVNFSENVTVTGTDSTLGLTIGSSSASAAYFSKTASSVTYRYSVQNNDNDSDGITVGNITLNGSTISDAATNNATLTLNSVGSTTAVLVDALAPTITSVTIPSNATYATGQHLDFTVNFSENVTLAGTDSTLGLTIGVTARTAAQHSTSANSISYRYTVQSGDIDNDGITVGAITLNTSTVRDGANNNATLTLNSVGSTTAVLVDTLVPVASAAGSVTTTGFSANWGSVTGANGYYLDVSTDSGFGSFVAGYNNLDAGNVTTHAVSGLTASSTYYYRVRAYNSGGTSANSNSITILPRFTVTPSAGAHGSIDPATAQPVLENGSATFTLTPDSGYHIDAVTGSCNGTLTGNSYTTSAITADCSVIASFAINTYTITTNATGNGTITCSSPIDHGAASACNISSDPGYRLTALTSNGSDILNSVTLEQITINNITEALTVNATFSPVSHGGLAITGSDTGPHATVHAADGTQHLVYERNGTLYYRSSAGISGNWSSEETVTTGQDPAIALKQDGTPLIAYLSGGQILTTARNSGAWSTPDDTGISANTIEIALDGNDKTHLAYTKTGSDGYDDILYTNNTSGAYTAPTSICDGAYLGSNWTFCRTPQIKADNDGNYHIAYNKQQINSALSAHDPQWMIYTTNASGGITISSHDLNPGAGAGTPQLLVRGSFGHDPLHGYTLIYGNDMEAAGLWLAENLQNGSWTETSIAVAGNAPSQGNNDTTQTRHLAYLAPDGRIMHTTRTASGYTPLTELAPSGALATVNPIKRSVLYRAEANGIKQLFQVGIDALALLTPLDGNLGTTVPGQTVEKQYTLTNNGSQPLTPNEIKTALPGYTFEIGTDNCSGTTITPGGTCTFTVRNSHQTYPNLVTDTLTITSNDPLRGTITLPLSLQVLEYHYPLAITMNGSGTVTATSVAISDFTCNSGTCSRDYDTNSIVTLTAQTPTGYTFSGFTFTGDGSACCKETSCNITITGNTNITATFVRNSYPISTLTVSNGTLTCTTPVSHGDQGSCTVTPDPGYRIEGIGGSCGGTLTGNSYTTLPITAGCTVGAVFAAAPQRSVTVTASGTGAGTVYSAPAGIICPLGSCTAQFDDATVTTLSAVPDTNSTFDGWSGACSNNAGPCDLTLTEDKSVNATFSAAPNAMVSTTGHATLTQAYAGTVNGATIKARAITFIENLVLNGNHRVTLEGGFNAEYDCNSCGGNTILKGTMTIEHGSLIMENLTIR